MYVLGVTGGIGSGKSTAARLFGELGAIVIGLDELAKRLTGPGGPLVDDVVAEFGSEVRGADGGVDAAALAALAFASPEATGRLDRIVHPGVYAAAAGALDLLAEMPEPPAIVVIDIPLLAESPEFFDLLDGVLVISASEDVRLARLVRRGMGEDDARARMARQASDAERRAIADWTIENDGSKVDFEADLVAFFDGELKPRGA
jgi:dephospho-CoA kinase